MAVAKGLTILGNGVNLACAFTQFDVNAEAESLDATTLCSTSKEFQPGFKSGSASANGIFKYEQTLLNEIHNVVSANFVAQTPVILDAALETIAIGSQAIMIDGIVSKYTNEAPLGQLITCSAEFMANGGVGYGVWLYGGVAPAAATTNGTSVDNAASTANGGIAHFQCTSTTGNTGVKIQHSTNNSTWVDLVTAFTDYAASELGGQTATVAAGTTVNRYLRAVVTTSAAGTVYCTFARR